jgi:hypothetical protein
MWAHLSCCGFEPPVAGPGPVTNRVRRNGAADLYQFVGDYTNPILKPKAAQAVKEHGDIELTWMPATLPSNQCWPGGVPFVFWNIGIEIIQQPHQVTILYSNDRDFRQIRMNQAHPAKVKPSWYGDPVGHYEGDVLVVDTATNATLYDKLNFNFLRDIAPVASIFRVPNVRIATSAPGATGAP